MSFKQALYAAAPGREIEPVSTPAGDTFVRTMTVREKDEWDVAAAKDGHFRARLIIASCCDEKGEPEFDEFDVARINEMPSHVLEPIIDAAGRLNRIGAKEAEALRKK